MGDGSEPPHRLVLGVRARYSTKGGAHKIEALLWIAPWRLHEVNTDFSKEREARAYGFEVWSTVYVGLDYEAAKAADDRLNKLMEQRDALTE